MNQQGECRIGMAITSFLVTAALVGCSQGGSGDGETKKAVPPPIAVAGDPELSKVVGPFATYGRKKMEDRIRSGEVYSPKSAELKSYLQKVSPKLRRDQALSDKAPELAQLPNAEKDKTTLILAFPMKFLGEQYVFGGIVTRVSDKESEDLGNLKLLELTPFHVRPIITGANTDEPQLSLLGCIQKCSERSVAEDQLDLPIVGVDTQNALVLVNLSAVGQKLNLVSIFDPEGEELALKPRTSYTSLIDYSASTLVFDVESEMIPTDSDISDPAAKVTGFTFRWYLKPASGFDPAFEQRGPVRDVGFFTTERSEQLKITRWNLTGNSEDTLHYFIKNVPDEHKEAFKMALESWNTNTKSMLGKSLISYEFLDASDPRYKYVVAGDVRFNVIEWDLDNSASYGGFGPSIANQFSGEIFSANTLIQGPAIINIYREWFAVSAQIKALKAEGRLSEAAVLLAQFQKKSERANKIGKAKVQLGRHNLKIGSLLPPLRDPLLQRGDFELVPDGFTFETYMRGYFNEMVAHEVGHNLGLRHNFYGNLGDKETGAEGTSSRSIMEYLPRRYRHINRIAEYDVMAINYGYNGSLPTHSGWYCTDEDVITPMNAETASPECSRDDASSDPFGYFESRLAQGVDYLINRGSPEAPAWSVGDMQRELGQSIIGLSFYAATAAHSSSWMNFNKEGRPTDASQVRGFVLTILKSHLCDPTFASEIAAKATPVAQQKTLENIKILRGATAKMLEFYGYFSKEELACK